MAVGLTAAATMIITACGSGGGGNNNSSTQSSNASGGNQALPAAFNAATIGFVNKSDKTGGSLNLVATGDCDSFGPREHLLRLVLEHAAAVHPDSGRILLDPRCEQRRHRA